MEEQEKLQRLDCSTIHQHIAMLQGIINRLAGNCANCKTWTVTIIAGTFAIAEIKLSTLLICFIVTAILFILDCYYFGIEKRLIEEQESFLDGILDLEKDGDKEEKQLSQKLFRIEYAPKNWTEYYKSIRAGQTSFSMRLFYYPIFIVLLILIWFYLSPYVVCIMNHLSTLC